MDKLLLLSGNDIPFPEAKTFIRQPRVKDIALLGEKDFFISVEMLIISKDKILANTESIQDKNDLVSYSDFDIFMSIVNNKEQSSVVQDRVDKLISLLYLLFPFASNIQFTPRAIVIFFKDENEKLDNHIIDAENFNIFKDYIKEIFYLQNSKEEEFQYNPEGELAKKIAEKLKKGREKVNEIRRTEKGEDSYIIERYLSILSIGLGIDINALLNLTVYQLFDLFKRYEKKNIYDVHLQARLAGATGLKDVDHWMS